MRNEMVTMLTGEEIQVGDNVEISSNRKSLERRAAGMGRPLSQRRASDKRKSLVDRAESKKKANRTKDLEPRHLSPNIITRKNFPDMGKALATRRKLHVPRQTLAKFSLSSCERTATRQEKRSRNTVFTERRFTLPGELATLFREDQLIGNRGIVTIKSGKVTKKGIKNLKRTTKMGNSKKNAKRNNSSSLSKSMKANDTKKPKESESDFELTPEQEDALLNDEQDSSNTFTSVTGGSCSKFSSSSPVSTEDSFNNCIKNASSPNSIPKERPNLENLEISIPCTAEERDMIERMEKVSRSMAVATINDSIEIEKAESFKVVLEKTEQPSSDRREEESASHPREKATERSRVERSQLSANRLSPYIVLSAAVRRSNRLSQHPAPRTIGKNKMKSNKNVLYKNSGNSSLLLGLNMNFNKPEQVILPLANKVMLYLKGYPNPKFIVTDSVKESLVVILNESMQSLEDRTKKLGVEVAANQYPIIALQHGQLLVGSDTEQGANLVLHIFRKEKMEKDYVKYGLPSIPCAVKAAENNTIANTFSITVPEEYSWDKVVEVSKARLCFSSPEQWIKLAEVELTRVNRDKSITTSKRYVLIMPNSDDYKKRLLAKAAPEEVFAPFIGQNKWIFKYMKTEKELGKRTSQSSDYFPNNHTLFQMKPKQSRKSLWIRDSATVCALLPAKTSMTSRLVNWSSSALSQKQRHMLLKSKKERVKTVAATQHREAAWNTERRSPHNRMLANIIQKHRIQRKHFKLRDVTNGIKSKIEFCFLEQQRKIVNFLSALNCTEANKGKEGIKFSYLRESDSVFASLKLKGDGNKRRFRKEKYKTLPRHTHSSTSAKTAGDTPVAKHSSPKDTSRIPDNLKGRKSNRKVTKAESSAHTRNTFDSRIGTPRHVTGDPVTILGMTNNESSIPYGDGRQIGADND